MIRFQRLTALLVVLLLLFTYIPADTYAFNTHDHTLNSAPDFSSSGSIVNPLLHGAIHQNTLQPALDSISSPEKAVTAGDIRYTLEDAADELRQAMIRREGEIAITYPADAPFDANAIWEVALSVTDDPKAGDYLAYQWGSLAWNLYADVIGGKQYFTTVFYLEYFTTAEQEAQMDAAVAALIAKLDLADKSEYDKIFTIYDWICSNVTYDHKNLNNDSYTLKFSAYAALIDKTAVCQGYSLLFYRLCMEAGISVRYISGDTPDGPHGWNIVGIDGLYYNVDATWDAPRKQVGQQYQWFLRGSSNFPDHARDDKYEDSSFTQTYRISSNDYGADITWPITGTCGSDLRWSLTEDGILTISGTGDMDDYYLNDPDWQEYAWHIRRIIIDEDVRSIGAYAFFQHDSLIELTVKGSALIKEAAFIYCTSLKEVSVDTVTALEDFAFFGCLNLERFVVGKSLTSIGQQVFADCLSLAKIDVAPENQHFLSAENVLFSKDMKRLIFAGSELSGAYIVPESVRTLDPYAFSCSANITHVTIPEGINTLPYGLFYWCDKLEGVDLPDSIVHIDERVFSGCSSLAEIQLPTSLTHIGYEAFANCSALTSLTIPASVQLIGELAFSHCNHLETIYFLGNVPDIADDSFASVFADAFYPEDNSTWTFDKMDDFGGFLVWQTFDDIHQYSTQIVPPTCSSMGYTLHTCSHCGHAYKTDEVEKLDHSYGQWTQNKAPSCTEQGQEQRKCTSCGHDEIRYVGKLSHVYTSNATAPTCTTQGYTTYTCVCGHSYQDSYISAMGHNFGQWTQSKAPSCAEAGEEHRLCSVCNYRDVKTIAATGHSYSEKITLPSCMTQGYTTFTCYCGNSYIDRYVPATDHSFINYVSDCNATCVADGTKTAKCDHGCGKADTVSDPGTKLDHDMSDWKVVSAPTLEQEGLERRTCRDCGHAEGRVIPKLTGPSQITSDVYHIQDGVITQIPANLTIADFLEGIPEAEYIWFYQDGKEVPSDSLVATGMELQLIVGVQIMQKLSVVVKGDVNGDGKISITDMLLVKSHLLNKTNLTDPYFNAADINGDGNTTITDFIQIKAFLLGKGFIVP